MALVGFKRLTIRILDGATAEKGKNLFVVEGKTGEGATQTAKITGLASDPVKTYGSDVAYYVSSRGVGDVKVELTAVDLPSSVINKILGYLDEDGIISVGADTVSPYCSILLESSTPSNEKAYLGFFKGQFSMDSLDLETIKEKQEELPSDSLSFSAIASDQEDTKGRYHVKYFGKDEAKVNKVKAQLQITAAG